MALSTHKVFDLARRYLSRSGRPATRALAAAKLADIDARVAALTQARMIVEWGMRCTCPTIETCTCDIHLMCDA